MLNLIVCVLFFGILLADNAYAYLDFGTGSYVLQILAASAIGFVFFIKNYLQKIKQFFIKKAPSDAEITQNIDGQE